MSLARARVFNRFGTALAEVEGHLGSVAWVLNGVGRGVYDIAKTDPKATATNLKLYNRLLLEFDNGLPNWGGPIVPNRRWTNEAIIKLAVKSVYHLLEKRTTDDSRYFESVPAGTIFQALIEEANVVEDTGIEIGDIWLGGPARTPAPYHYTVLADAINRLVSLTGCDFALVPYVNGSGLLRFKAHWYEERGLDRPGVALIEDHNAVVMDFDERGELVNEWAGIGQGQTWTEKIKGTSLDVASRAMYGILQNVVAYPNVSVQATLDSNLDELLEQSRQPWTRIMLKTWDMAPATFASYDVGDRVLIQLHSYGFSGGSLGYEGAVRVLAREYNPYEGTCSLVVEEAAFK